MFKKRAVEDERIVGANQRYNSEALGILSWGLLIDIFYRSVILRQDFMAYWDVSLIFFGTCFYLVIRKVSAGVFAFEGMKKAWRRIITSSLIAGASITATLYFIGMEHSPTHMLVNFLIGTVTFGVIMALFYYFSNRFSER
ncbi:MAG: DUF6773 family protein [Methylocystaceae bacterium]